MGQFMQPSYTPLPASERVRIAWQRRSESDYVFDFWTSFGWILLSCGVYLYYVFYQLMRRARDHNLRRLELLDAAAALAWERAEAEGLAEELRPHFERMSVGFAELRRLTTEFRDPTIWLVLAIFTGVALWVGYVLLDMDLIRHQQAEAVVESELAAVYARLEHPLPFPPPNAVKGPHNYAGRVIAAIFSCGVYGYFWLYDMETEGNVHYAQNWTWEDALASAVQQMS